MSDFIWEGITSIATIATAGIAWWQLSGLKSTLKYNGLMAVLEMEAEMHRRKEKFDDANIKMRNYEITAGAAPSVAAINVMKDEISCALEGYLNSIDRLAYCIVKGFLKDRDWRKEYEEMFRATVVANEAKFGPATRFVHIVDLNDKWKRK